MKKWYQIEAKADRVAEIMIYDIIGKDPWTGEGVKLRLDRGFLMQGTDHDVGLAEAARDQHRRTANVLASCDLLDGRLYVLTLEQARRNHATGFTDRVFHGLSPGC